MRGKAQTDDWPARELIKTPVLLFTSCGPLYTFIATSWSLHGRHINMSAAMHTGY